MLEKVDRQTRVKDEAEARQKEEAFWTGNEQLRGQSDLISREQHARRLLDVSWEEGVEGAGGERL